MINDEKKSELNELSEEEIEFISGGIEVVPGQSGPNSQGEVCAAMKSFATQEVRCLYGVEPIRNNYKLIQL